MTYPWKNAAKLTFALTAAMPLGACVTVKPPDKPIEVNFNVDIKQEVTVRLQQDVQQLIKQNPEAFPAPATRP